MNCPSSVSGLGATTALASGSVTQDMFLLGGVFKKRLGTLVSSSPQPAPRAAKTLLSLLTIPSRMPVPPTHQFHLPTSTAHHRLQLQLTELPPLNVKKKRVWKIKRTRKTKSSTDAAVLRKASPGPAPHAHHSSASGLTSSMAWSSSGV